jgi:hypothetical protein
VMPRWASILAKIVPHRWPRSARRDRAAAEVIARPGRSAARRNGAVPDRHGSLRWCTSLEQQPASALSRCATDAREICARIAEAVQRPTNHNGATVGPPRRKMTPSAQSARGSRLRRSCDMGRGTESGAPTSSRKCAASGFESLVRDCFSTRNANLRYSFRFTA